MPEQTDGAALGEAQRRLRDHFIGWQCRIRQKSMRQAEGRPGSGMRPTLSVAGQGEIGPVNVQLLKREAEEETAELRHMVRKTHDPAERLKNGLRFLSSAYYQRPADFTDLLSGVFATDSELAAGLLELGECRLDFEQYGQRYRLHCRVRATASEEAGHQATYWHNHLFNPAMPGAVTVLEFRPDWSRSSADPAVP